MKCTKTFKNNPYCKKNNDSYLTLFINRHNLKLYIWKLNEISLYDQHILGNNINTHTLTCMCI